MSKRKNRKQRSRPNLPEETLARARREAGIEEEIADEEEAVEAEEAETRAEAKAAAPPVQRQTALPPIERRRSSGRRDGKPEELSQMEVAARLANPTRVVSTEQLKTQYGYVLADLRSMGLLAAFLFVAMIVAARFL